MQVSTQEVWTLLGVMIGGGVAVTLVAGALKKVFKLETAAVIHTLVIGLAAVTAAAQYILSAKNLPPSILGLSTTAIYGASQVVYKYSTYAQAFLNKVKVYNDGQKAAPADSSVSLTDPQTEATATTTAEF